MLRDACARDQSDDGKKACQTLRGVDEEWEGLLLLQRDGPAELQRSLVALGLFSNGTNEACVVLRTMVSVCLSVTKKANAWDRMKKAKRIKKLAGVGMLPNHPIPYQARSIRGCGGQGNRALGSIFSELSFFEGPMPPWIGTRKHMRMRYHDGWAVLMMVSVDVSANLRRPVWDTVVAIGSRKKINKMNQQTYFTCCNLCIKLASMAQTSGMIVNMWSASGMK